MPGVEARSMPTTWYVAPGISTANLSNPPTFEEKVRVFERSVLGWQLEIAEALINGSKAIAGSGYAVLSIVASYPEMIWQFVNGRESKGRSPAAFREGMALIFPDIDVAAAHPHQPASTSGRLHQAFPAIRLAAEGVGRTQPA